MVRSVEALCNHQDPLASLLDQVLAGTSNTGVALDHGCGFGRVSAALSRRGWHSVGLDFAREGLPSVQQLASDASALAGDIRQLPFRDGSFDCAISIGVVEHLREGPLQALHELRRVLRKGSRALITVPHQNWMRTLRDKASPLGQRRHGYDIGALPALPAAGDVPAGFYQYAFTRSEFEPFLAASGLAIERWTGHAIVHGLGDTTIGTAAHTRLQRRYQGTQSYSSPASDSPTLRAKLRSQLRALYDETDRTALARAVRRGAGPAVGHMMAFVTTAV